MSESNPPLSISVAIGDNRDYQGGHLLNAIDAIVCFYSQRSPLGYDDIAKLLRVYADCLEGK